MSGNGYFNHSANRISDGTTARGSQVNNIGDEIEAGFDKLASENDTKHGKITYCTASEAAANTFTASLTYAPDAYYDGLEAVVKFPAANTGAATLNLNSLGARSIKRLDGSALSAGDIPANKIIALRYNSTSGYFEIQSCLVANVVSEAEAAQAAAETAQSGAETAQGLAEAAQAASEAAYDSFDDRYLGAKASDPATDNDGDALLAGAVYWNTTSGQWKVYTGSAWQTLPGGQIHVSDSRPSASMMQNGDTWIKSNYSSGSAWAVYTIVDTGDSGKDALQAVVDISNGKWLSHDNSESVDVDCTAGGTINLSTLQDAYGVINLTGTPGAKFDVVSSTRKLQKKIINSSDGTATHKTSVGTGVVVAVGVEKGTRCDGTNIVESDSLPIDHVEGLLWSNNGVDATNDFDISAGARRSDDDAEDLILASSQTKRMDAVWSSGNNGGVLTATAWGATGWVGSTSYHIFIANISGEVEIIGDTDPAGGNIDTDHSSPKKRRVFSLLSGAGPSLPSLKTSFDGQDIVAILDAPSLDYNSSGSTGGALQVLAVPTGIKVPVMLSAFLSDTTTAYGLITEVAQSNSTPTSTNHHLQGVASGQATTIETERETDTSGQIRHRLSKTVAVLQLFTLGYRIRS